MKLKILIAPLDWGLGHVTRCLPIISYLMEKGHEVVAAAEGASKKLLAENVPTIQIIPLAGYNIQYSSSGKKFAFKIIRQVPKILRAIKAEHQWLGIQHQEYGFDLVISDNRYGLYHKNLPSVVLTHQLNIKSGKGRVVDKLIQKVHYKLLHKFSACWVVDYPSQQGLSGALAHPRVIPKNVTYIGTLSQLCSLPDECGDVADNLPSEPQQVLILISGPEPMRSQLEETLIRQVITMERYTFTFIAGNPAGKAYTNLPAHVTFHPYLTAKQLKVAMAGADIVVCRSGYSTIMDLAAMRKKALLIPTPGQTEQEYLASYLKERGFFHYASQKHLKLGMELSKALSYKGVSDTFYQSHLLMHKAIDGLLELYFSSRR